MGPTLFASAVLLVGGVLLTRRLRARLRERAFRAAPGHTPGRPLRIERMDEIDATLEQTRCFCGGSLVPLSEGTVSGPEGTLRVAHAECLRCEADLHLYFDLGALRH